MTYATADALRSALEHRLGELSRGTGISMDRLRRRVVFERVVARLETAEPGRWVVKGGMALEVRLRDDARLTKDLDLGLREAISDPNEIRERLIDALGKDPDSDRFVISVGATQRCAEDGRGHVTWRLPLTASLAGRQFGAIKLDVSPREHELGATDRVTPPNSLEFAGIVARDIEIIDVHRHAAEKLHAMQEDFGDRENSRVRDLVDVVLLHEHGLLEPDELGPALRTVWEERDSTNPPDRVPGLPAGWPARYEAEAAELGLNALSFEDAVSIVDALWLSASIRKGSTG